MKLIRLSFSIYWKMAGYWMADFIIQALQGIEQHAERTVNSITPICSIPFDLGYFSANTYLWKLINSQCYILLLWTKKKNFCSIFNIKGYIWTVLSAQVPPLSNKSSHSIHEKSFWYRSDSIQHHRQPTNSPMESVNEYKA